LASDGPPPPVRQSAFSSFFRTGTRTTFPHSGQRTFFPSFDASTLQVWSHPAQVTGIISSAGLSALAASSAKAAAAMASRSAGAAVMTAPVGLGMGMTLRQSGFLQVAVLPPNSSFSR
jgi:hypothetical protein